MKLDFVPLLQITRDLYDIRRGGPPDFNGGKRFWQYLRTIFPEDESTDQLLPLLISNPMAKDHVTAALDALLAMDAEAVGAREAAELRPHLHADDKRTAIECLFGDAAGRTLGFTPRGLSPWAGLALALHDARREQQESALIS